MPYKRTYLSAWAGAQPTGVSTDLATVMLAHVFEAQVDGYILGAKYARNRADAGQHIAFLAPGTTAAWQTVAPFPWRPSNGTGFEGWESAYFRPRLRLLQGQRCLIGVWFQTGRWYATGGGLVGGPIGNSSIRIPQDTSGLRTTYYTYSMDLNPNNTFGGNAYGVDCIFWPH
jgi:hypothetical protein